MSVIPMLEKLAGKPALLFLFETDCPTCRLAAPCLNRLAAALPAEGARVVGISQDDDRTTREFVAQTGLGLEILLDRDLTVSRRLDPEAVPALFLLDAAGDVVGSQIGFDKSGWNALAASLCSRLGVAPVPMADPYDGLPASKPGCASRHREAQEAPTGRIACVTERPGARASRIALHDNTDPYEYCLEAGFADALPVAPPTVERVERMLRATPLEPDLVVGRIPPNYGPATVEKIAANAVMAGCPPELMRVLVPLVRAACDERFNLHGIQATTHFAAPLIILHGPVRRELGFASGSNVFSNVARANSSLGRALSLLLVNLGGARPGGIDMSTLGNPGKFSYCIAENEEESPWEPFHVERGFPAGQSALTLFAAEPPRGVSEHNARDGAQVLRAVCRVLATVWSYRMCLMPEAVVVLCPEHVKTLARDDFSRRQVRQFLFDHTAIPLSAYQEAPGEGTNLTHLYERVQLDGQECYRKFRSPEAISIVVAGGTAGKFSAVIGSWATGPRGSQMVTYPVE